MPSYVTNQVGDVKVGVSEGGDAKKESGTWVVLVSCLFIT
jgi:hypothetical protein